MQPGRMCQGLDEYLGQTNRRAESEQPEIKQQTLWPLATAANGRRSATGILPIDRGFDRDATSSGRVVDKLRAHIDRVPRQQVSSSANASGAYEMPLRSSKRQTRPELRRRQCGRGGFPNAAKAAFADRNAVKRAEGQSDIRSIMSPGGTCCNSRTRLSSRPSSKKAVLMFSITSLTTSRYKASALWRFSLSQTPPRPAIFGLAGSSTTGTRRAGQRRAFDRL